MKKITSILFVLLSLCPFTPVLAQKPNVIIVLADDQGYGDMGCNGNPWIKTPNMDRLHSQSLRFTNFHSGTTCAPTRAGLMTGKYCSKVGVWHTIQGRSILNPNETILAETLKNAGYTTAIFGKWHLGDNYPYRPQDRGFDEVLIHGGGGVGQQPDYWNNDYFDDTYFRNGKPEKFKGYCTDVWFSEALKFIEKNKNHPFFCYLATNAPHHPFHVENKYSDPYKNIPNIPNPNFYGMITNLDENLGKLQKALDSMRIAKNTILIYMSDNGTSGGVELDKDQHISEGYNAGMRGKKGSCYEGGHRVPFFLQWPNGGIIKGKDISTITSYIDVMPTIIDLCGISTTIPFDGRSLKPLIYSQSQSWPDRILFTDTQRGEFLMKWKKFAVMTDRWRLVGKHELYDISKDPAEKINIAADHPEVLEKLLAAYDLWWNDVSEDSKYYNRIEIGSTNSKRVSLNSHDLHTGTEGEEGPEWTQWPAWSQTMVREAKGKNGFWAIHLPHSGKYEFALYRWPRESHLKLNDAAPLGEEVPGGTPYPEGQALKIINAGIHIDGQEFSSKVYSQDSCAKLIIELRPGNYNLKCHFTDIENIERSAYYVYVKLLGQ